MTLDRQANGILWLISLLHTPVDIPSLTRALLVQNRIRASALTSPLGIVHHHVDMLETAGHLCMARRGDGAHVWLITAQGRTYLKSKQQGGS